MTTAEYLQTPETVLPRELAFGELRVADAPTVSHQRVVGELFIGLTRHVREQKLGEVMIAPVDVVLDADQDLIVQPDLLFVAADRHDLVGDRIFGAPDIVVEVLSPYPRIGGIEEKVGWYARYGVRECWLASLAKKEIAVLTLSDGAVASRALFARGQPVTSDILGELDLVPVNVFGW
jgi:Uma2 family endonuclease